MGADLYRYLLIGGDLELGNLSYRCYLAGPASCLTWSWRDPLETPCLVASLLYLAALATSVAARRLLLRQPPPDAARERWLPAHHGIS